MTDSREAYEAAIGAIITRFNDIEVALIERIKWMVNDDAKGEAIGWALGFRSKVDIIGAMAREEYFASQDWKADLFKALNSAKRLSETVRNQVDHAELWENPTDDSINFRKGRTSDTKGFVPSQPDWTVAQLMAYASEIDTVAYDLRGLTAMYHFRNVEP